MNANMVSIIKRIIAEQGEAILANPQRLKGFVADYASRESKAERLAFGRCIEYGAYNELKNAQDKAARQAAKATAARRVHANEGMDIALCNDALDALEAAIFGEATAAVQPETPPEISVPKSSRSGKKPAPESKPFPIDNNFSYAARQPIKTMPIEEKHPGRNAFIVVVLLAAFIAGVSYFSSNRNALSNNPSATANHTQEQSAPERDINGLTAADYDINGWAQKDGKWVASPDGARYSAPAANAELPQVRIVNNTGYMVYYVYVVAVPAQFWGDDKLGSNRLSNGGSVSISLPSSSTYRYGIRLKDLDGDTYTKWNIPISNNQTITFTIEDLDID
jgi:hypothetical protein